MVANAKKRGVPAIEFKANCPASVAVGDFVYIASAAVGDIIQVNTVDVAELGTMPAFGVVISKITPVFCTVRTSGEVTTTTILTPGKRYFISDSGQLSDSMPAPVIGGKAAVQAAAYALDTNRMLLTLDQIPIVRVG